MKTHLMPNEGKEIDCDEPHLMPNEKMQPI
jgi:hypothetical protein